MISLYCTIASLFQANTLLKDPTPSVSYNQLKKKSTLQRFKALKVVFSPLPSGGGLSKTKALKVNPA